ncbi:isochorismatase family protein [Streptomyces hygroscopicus]|uniref:isochorismatase family protein n=1 Tax=Streptomyces hygroscopicus TaxID=1912 RepID=UPI000824F6D2|nr:isochorismatase family protein [Streptomyces hygroscopicus]
MPGIPDITAYPMPGERDVPTNTARWTVRPDRAVLLVHDMQRYFLRPFADAQRRELIGNVVLLRERCERLGIPVAFTAQPGSMTEEQRGLLMDFWGPGMCLDLADRAVTEELAPRPHDWVFTKWRYSAFFRSDLLMRMRAHGRDQLIVCGIYAHIGVLATAVDAFTHDIRTFLVADAVADFSAEEHRLALAYAARRCAVVATTRGLPAGSGTLVGHGAAASGTGAVA